MRLASGPAAHLSSGIEPLKEEALSIGFSYSPFLIPIARRPGLNVQSLFFDGYVGYSALYEIGSDDKLASRGAQGGAGFDWLPVQGIDWSFGIQMSETLSIYSAQLRHTLQALFALELDLGKHIHACPKC